MSNSRRSTRSTRSTADLPAASAALQAALDGLPAKPRVHELARRTQMSSKEIIAALADRGVAVASASSGVDLATATALLTDLLGEPGDAGTGPVADPGRAPDSVPASAPDADITAAAAVPIAERPLFLPPEPVAPPRRRRKKTVPQDGEPVPTESAGPAWSDTETAPGVAEPGGTGDSSDVAADQSDEVAEVAAEPAATDGGSGGRKRRRRGRRGRGRVQDEQDTDGDSDAAGNPAAAESGSPTGSASGSDSAIAAVADLVAGPDDADTASDTAADSDDDADADSDGEAGTRRRRRRRRRTSGSGDSGDSTGDDPDNTVVHVREPRRETPTDEVQGIRGSTRLEAKRQRRRDGRGAARRPAILTEAEFLARREAVDRVMAVRQRGDLAQVALLEDDVLVEHFVSRAGSASMIGNVYLGKVQNVLPSMEAAFIDIGRGRNAVLYAGEVNWDASGLVGKTRRIEAALSSGDTVLVQVSKDPVGHKGARLTTQISLPGRFLVYVPGGGATGISRKLPDTERKRLKAILDRIVPTDAGVIIRTAAEGVPEEELQRDVERLKQQWAEITKAAEKIGSAPKQLSAEPDTLIKVIRDLFNSDINRLVVDGDDAWSAIDDYVTGVAPELADRVSRYSASGGAADVFGRYRIDEQIAKALERKVHLPSGGSLVIDRTEAMTVVDVNTGKYTGSGGNLEETVTRNNLEAAEEIVRQLRLRDIGGIIVVDFIDMVLESNRDLVLRRLTECLGRDRTRHQVAEVTSLGLVQMTRKRMGTGLVEAFSEPCPHCGGRGIVLHDVPIAAGGAEDDEPKSGRARRQRGRRSDDGGREAKDTSRDVEVPILSVVSTRPDPRGPRGPRPPAPNAVGEEAAGEVAVDPADERVEAALTADETVGLESGEQVADVVAEATAAVAAVESVPSPTEAVPAAQVDEPAAKVDEPVRPARRRRAAGRPAGAPSTVSTAVDIVLPSVAVEQPAPQQAVPEQAAAEQPAAEQPVAEQPAAEQPAAEQPAAKPARKRASRSRKATQPAGAAAVTEPAAAAVVAPTEPATAPATPPPGDQPTGNGATAKAVAAVAAVETAPPTRAPRRRRAATRPSGPAGEPVTITGPAPSTP